MLIYNNMRKSYQKNYAYACSYKSFSDELHKYFDFFTGVPDSYFKNILYNLHPYIAAPRENHAFAMAFGARLAGARPCVLLQNSGLGLSVDVIYGLFHLYKLGVVMVISNRGKANSDSIQHHIWGEKTIECLRLLDVAIFEFQRYGLEVISKANSHAFNSENLSAILINKGDIA